MQTAPGCDPRHHRWLLALLYAHADGLLAAQADEGPMDTDKPNIVVNQVFSEWTGESTARMTRTVSEAARIMLQRTLPR